VTCAFALSYRQFAVTNTIFILDEISALVLDPGQCWTRAGFAGEDTPKSVIPSHYGYVEGAGPDGTRKLYFGDNDVHTVRTGMEIANPMSDGVGASSLRFPPPV